MDTTKKMGTTKTVRRVELSELGSVHGVCCDAHGRVWFAEGDGDLYCVDPTSGRVLTSYTHLAAYAGTTFDGTHLWQLSGDVIRRIDPEDGSVERTIPAPTDVHGAGMAFAEGALWIGDFAGKGVVKVDATTGAVLKRIEADRFVTGVAWSDEGLWYGAWDAQPEPAETSLRRIDPESGETLEELAFEDGYTVSGVDVDAEGRIWCGGSSSGGLRAVRRGQEG